MKLKSVKPLIVIGTQRSGSTLFYSILAEYLRQTRGAQPIGEFFNWAYHSFWESDGRLTQSFYRSPLTEIKPYPESIFNSIIEHRMWLLMKYKKHISIKLHAKHIPFKYYEMLHRHFDWIYVERNNLFEQLLSIIVSRCVHVWSVNKLPRLIIEPKTLTATAEHIAWFESIYRRYLEIKATYPASARLVYEDFEHDPDPQKILTSIGLVEQVDYSQFKIPLRQNPGDKLSLFTNPEFILDSYRKSFLNDLYPLS